MKVKGTLLMDYVRMILSVKDKDWSKHLTPEDLALIDSTILPSQWRPFESLQRMGVAIFKELAHSDLNLVRSFGKFMAGIFTQVYQNIVAPGNPIASVEKVANIQRTFFRDVNGSGAVLAKGDHWFTFGVDVDFAVTGDEAGEAVGFQTAGLLEGIIEKSGGKNVRSDISRNQGGFEIKFNWE